MRRILLVLVIVLTVSGCAVVVKSGPSNKSADIAESFFDVYAKRQDIDTLMTFYADNIVLRDMVYGDEVKGKDAVKGFLRWGDTSVELMQSQSLVVTEQVANGAHVITRGYFLPFKYHGQDLGPWHFVIWQTFNAQGLITHQTDWINYTPKEQFVDGMDLNQNIRL